MNVMIFGLLAHSPHNSDVDERVEVGLIDGPDPTDICVTFRAHVSV
jgi:hypothetical protein